MIKCERCISIQSFCTADQVHIKMFVLRVCILSLVSFQALAVPLDPFQWTHSLDLGQDVKLRWSNEGDDAVRMEMSAPTTGYVAIGFSPTEGMRGSDIIMGWVDESGVGHILDMYAVGVTTPIEDPELNVELLDASQADGRTTIAFRRKWDTCDKHHDFIIGDTTVTLIWAYNGQDPFMFDGQFTAVYHDTARGIRKSFLRTEPVHASFPDAGLDSATAAGNDVKWWDVRMGNNTIDAEDDIYFCAIAKFPAVERKHHMIGFRPILEEANKYRIHHIITYECIVPAADGKSRNIFEKHVGAPSGRCYTPNMPPEWGKYCINIPVLLTSGSDGTMFPSNVGFPLGEEHGGSTYFMFEIHYDNPSLEKFTDNSGVRIFYTDKLREHDGAVMAVGHKISPFETVPHGMHSFTSVGYCPGECTKQTLPESGIHAFSVLLHAHYSGRKIALRHIRDGVELEPMAKDNHYDYNYQTARSIGFGPEYRKILPGDQLMTVCEYDTGHKNVPSFGGVGTRDEMCMSFVYYYPKADLAECKTQPEFYSYLNALGVTSVAGNILTEMQMPYSPTENQAIEYPDNPFYLKNSTYEEPLNGLDAMYIVDGDQDTVARYSTVGQLVRNLNWTDTSVGAVIEDKWMNGQHYAFCTGGNRKRFPLTEYKVLIPKEYEKLVEDEKSQCAPLPS